MMETSNIMDTRQIKALMKDFDESNLSRLKIEKEGFMVEFEKATVTAAAPAQQVVTAAPAAQPQQLHLSKLVMLLKRGRHLQSSKL